MIFVILTHSDDNPVPSQPEGASASVTTKKVEQVPIRFYSNGFTVGDGELRSFEENRGFIEYIKRGEMPPELRSMNSNGQQIEVRNIVELRLFLSLPSDQSRRSSW